MKKRNLFLILIFSISILLLQHTAFAQYTVKHSVFGNGVAVIKDSSNTIAGTAGQTLIGKSSNSSFSANAGFWYQSAKFYTSVEEIPLITAPKEFRLDQNYPNPFNPSTTIRFAIHRECKVCLKIFDLLGREVGKLIDEDKQPGEYRVTFEAEGLPSGIYFYRIQAEGFSQLKKFTLLK